MSEVATIDMLVEASEKETLRVRKRNGVLPEQANETFVRFTNDLRATGRSLRKFQEKERFGKYLNVLANFPILKTEPLLLLQEVTLKVRLSHEEFSCVAQLPLFGVVKWRCLPDLPHSIEVVLSGDYVRMQFRGEFPEFPESERYRSLLGGGFGSIAGQIIPPYHGFKVYQNIPEVPKKISKIAEEGCAYGFTDLGVVWGPATYKFEKIPLKKDPLLIGKMFDTWWILDQWGVTDAEKKLTPTAED